jgi:hypothetical protein
MSETSDPSNQSIRPELFRPSNPIPFGLRNGKLVSVAQVERGKACGCICPGCESELVASKGEGRNSPRHHFRHLHKNNCEDGLETGLHMLAKEILTESSSLKIPAVIARHGNREKVLKPERELSYCTCSPEPTTTESGTPNLRPDLLVAGELNGNPFQLFVEIYVRHKSGWEKINKLEERGIAAIEIDLSHVPADETREFYEDAILRTADRCWLYSPRAEKEQLRMSAEAEKRYGYIGEKITAALCESQTNRWNAWVEPVTDAGLAELIGLKIDGDACFATTAEIWQAAILYQHVLSNQDAFRTRDTVNWLVEQGLLKPAFIQLLQQEVSQPHERYLDHVEDYVQNFLHPVQVVSHYAGELFTRGKLEKHPGAGGYWRVPSPVVRAANERQKPTAYWRLRLAQLKREFEVIKETAIQGGSMDWDVWLGVPLSAHGGQAARNLIKAPEDRFQALVAHLQELEAMLEPGGAIPAVGLANLPLEPERNARIAERKAAERVALESQQRAEATKEPKRNVPSRTIAGAKENRPLLDRLSTKKVGLASGWRQRLLEEGLGFLRRLFRTRA